MFKNARILVCTDFSESSDHALKVAAVLSKKAQGEILLLHVAELEFYLNWKGHMMKGDVAQQVQDLAYVDLMERMKEQTRRCQTEATCLVSFEASAVKEILQEISDKKIDLVVIGAKGSTGLKEFLLGGLTWKIASASPVPVLVVKNEKTMKRVSALVEGSEPMSDVITLAEEVAQLNEADLEVISLCASYPGLYFRNSLEYSTPVMNAIREEGERNVERVREKLGRALTGNPTKVIVQTSNEASLANHLVEILEDEYSNLAVMKRSHKTVMDKFIMGSVSSKVMENFKGNVLIC